MLFRELKFDQMLEKACIYKEAMDPPVRSEPETPRDFVCQPNTYQHTLTEDDTRAYVDYYLSGNRDRPDIGMRADTLTFEWRKKFADSYVTRWIIGDNKKKKLGLFDIEGIGWRMNPATNRIDYYNIFLQDADDKDEVIKGNKQFWMDRIPWPDEDEPEEDPNDFWHVGVEAFPIAPEGREEPYELLSHVVPGNLTAEGVNQFVKFGYLSQSVRGGQRIHPVEEEIAPMSKMLANTVNDRMYEVGVNFRGHNIKACLREDSYNDLIVAFSRAFVGTDLFETLNNTVQEIRVSRFGAVRNVYNAELGKAVRAPSATPPIGHEPIEMEDDVPERRLPPAGE